MAVEVDVKQGTLEAARTFLAIFSGLFFRRGWIVSVHGSTIERTRGRDIDFIFNHYPGAEQPTSEDELVLLLKRMGFEVLVDERLGDMRGLSGVLRGYALDITLIGGNP